jgi:hypothetical protein
MSVAWKGAKNRGIQSHDCIGVGKGKVAGSDLSRCFGGNSWEKRYEKKCYP